MVNDLEKLLPQSLQQLADDAPHRPDLAARARRGVRRQRIMAAGPAAVVMAVLVVLGSVWISRGTETGTGTGPADQAPSACQPLLTSPIPQWARGGFTGPSSPSFAYSTSGDMVAIVFGDPLTAPPTADHNNKILWVPRSDTGEHLVITAHLEGTDQTATIDTGAPPGPSTVDMPAPGCWQLDLRWGEHSDSINLRWIPTR